MVVSRSSTCLLVYVTATAVAPPLHVVMPMFVVAPMVVVVSLCVCLCLWWCLRCLCMCMRQNHKLPHQSSGEGGPLANSGFLLHVSGLCSCLVVLVELPVCLWLRLCLRWYLSVGLLGSYSTVIPPDWLC